MDFLLSASCFYDKGKNRIGFGTLHRVDIAEFFLGIFFLFEPRIRLQGIKPIPSAYFLRHQRSKNLQLVRCKIFGFVAKSLLVQRSLELGKLAYIYIFRFSFIFVQNPQFSTQLQESFKISKPHFVGVNMDPVSAFGIETSRVSPVFYEINPVLPGKISRLCSLVPYFKMLVLPNLRQKPLYQVQTAVSRLEYIVLIYWEIHFL